MRNRLLLASSFPAFGLLLLALLLVPMGCGSPDKAKTTDPGKKPPEDPWLRVATTLRQESDTGSCRRVLSELNQALASTPVDSQAKLGDAEAAFIQSNLNLTEAEMKEVRSSGYTSLDPNHLADGLYLRDAARSLDIAKVPVAERAAIAFAWVCRQVILLPWSTPTGQNRFQSNPPLPPTYVLRRGTGSGLERMLVFGALCRQLEIDTYLIGPAVAAGQPVLYQQPGKESEFPRGPFWSIGVRDGADILLFDPWKEQALPGKNGRPATLADVRANPREVAVWLDNKEFAWGVTVEDLKSGEIYLTATLSSMALRQKILEEKLAADIGAKLFTNLVEEKKNAERAAKGVPIRFYSPAQEPYSPTRVLNTFLPVAEGGLAVEEAVSFDSKYWNYIRDQLPKDQLISLPGELRSAEARNRLANLMANVFRASFLNPPTPREKIQRGQFVEVTQQLVRLRDQFAASETQKRNMDQAAIREWCDKLDGLTTEFNLARREDQPAIRAQIEEFWKTSATVVGNLVSGSIAGPGLAESTYMLSLAKHEQAERTWAKAQKLAAAVEPDPSKKAQADKVAALAKSSAIEAWLDARDWWARYEPLADVQKGSYPGRAELAKRLTERANKLAGAQ